MVCQKYGLQTFVIRFLYVTDDNPWQMSLFSLPSQLPCLVFLLMSLEIVICH